MPTRPDVAAQVRRPLDALNFFLADVRDGLGPYLAIYLLTVQRWDEASFRSETRALLAELRMQHRRLKVLGAQLA